MNARFVSLVEYSQEMCFWQVISLAPFQSGELENENYCL